MTTTAQPWTEQIVEAAGSTLQLIKGGSGEPLLILHDEIGHPGWLRFHHALSENYTLNIPSPPGFGESPQLEWVMGMHDLARWYLGALDDLGLESVKVIGISLGGWLAAEMASMCPQQFKKMVLVDALGVRPPTGEIYDIFQVVAKAYVQKGIKDASSTPEYEEICPDEPGPELQDLWDTAREGACRLGWKPYMHYPNLPEVLPRLKRLPTLVVWGRDDTIVPVSAGQLYHDSIPGSKLEIIDNCGHRPEVEKPEEFIRIVQDFLRD